MEVEAWIKQKKELYSAVLSFLESESVYDFQVLSENIDKTIVNFKAFMNFIMKMMIIIIKKWLEKDLIRNLTYVKKYCMLPI